MNNEVMKIVGEMDLSKVREKLEAARIKAKASVNRGLSGSEDVSVSSFYELYFESIIEPVLKSFVGEVRHSHEKGALYARVNEVFRIAYGREVAPAFEKIRSEDRLSGTYKGISFDQADVVIAKGKEDCVFSGRAIQYSFATGIMGKIVIMEKGALEGIGGGEETSEKAKDDFSDLEADGIFGGFDADPSASSFDHARSVTKNSSSNKGAVWANDTANAKLFPGLSKTFTSDPAFQERFLVFSDDPIGTRRLLTTQLTEALAKLDLPGNSCLIIERDRVVLLRNKISGIMEVDLECPIDPVQEIEKNFADMQETVKLLDALREVSAIVAEENSGFEA